MKDTKLNPQEKIKRIDFGDIDGLYEANLTKYFLDENYWEKLGKSKKCFIIGRKGTGKSALYQWIKNQALETGAAVSNLSFGDFPIAKLLALKDDDYARPHQYHTIIRNILLCELAKQIVSIDTAPRTETWRNLAEYVNFIFGQNLSDLHKQIVTITHKSDAGITQPIKLGVERGKSITYGAGESQLHQINRMLSENLNQYLAINHLPDIVIQIDQLDDNYNSYRDKAAYKELILSLLKAIYEINQQFHQKEIRVKVIVYIRSDIFHSLNKIDAESARWDGLLHTINWSIVNKTDWKNPKLLQILNLRISNSLSGEDFTSVFPDDLTKMKDQGISTNLFKFIVHRSFHRPRDVIQFCIKIQGLIKDDGKLISPKTIEEAEKKYALWFLSEVENEIAAEISQTDDLYELLRNLGGKAISYTDFCMKYQRYESIFKLNSDSILRLLYQYGIINNIALTRTGEMHEMYSIIRNEKSIFVRDMHIQLHVGYQRSLYISKFSGGAPS